MKDQTYTTPLTEFMEFYSEGLLCSSREDETMLLPGADWKDGIDW